MPRVVHFEFNADNPERAASFYTNVFGWKIEKWAGPMDYWIVMTGEQSEPGIDSGIKKRSEEQNTVNTVDVPSVDEFVKKVTGAGGKVVQPRTAVPGVGYFAYCQDTEGNIFGMMQSDTSAK
jgi:predicted enzyme related to lactoylglutathione lyase